MSMKHLMTGSILFPKESIEDITKMILVSKELNREAMF